MDMVLVLVKINVHVIVGGSMLKIAVHTLVRKEIGATETASVLEPIHANVIVVHQSPIVNYLVVVQENVSNTESAFSVFVCVMVVGVGLTVVLLMMLFKPVFLSLFLHSHSCII